MTKSMVLPTTISEHGSAWGLVYNAKRPRLEL